MKQAKRKEWVLDWLVAKHYRDFSIYDAYLVDTYVKEVGQRGRLKHMKDGSISCKRLEKDLRSLGTDGRLKRLGKGKYILPEPPQAA